MTLNITFNGRTELMKFSGDLEGLKKTAEKYIRSKKDKINDVCFWDGTAHVWWNEFHSAWCFSPDPGCGLNVCRERRKRLGDALKFLVELDTPRTYYELPLDQYNQPIGYVTKVTMTPREFYACKGRYLFDNEYAANARADN